MIEKKKAGSSTNQDERASVYNRRPFSLLDTGI